MKQTVYSLSLLVCSATLFAIVCSQPAHGDPSKISAVANTQFQGQTSGMVSLVFKVEGLKKVPTVRVVSTSQGGPGAAISGDTAMVAEWANGAFWQVPVFITNLPMNSSFNVLLVVHVDDNVSDVLSYSVSNNLPVVDADVSSGSDTIFLEKSRETDFLVNVKGRPLRGLTICQAALADANTGDHLQAEHLRLYLAEPDVAANPQDGSSYLTLTAASSKVHLFVSPEFQDKGIFAGNVGLCSANKASVATLKLTINSTSLSSKIAGACLIVVGIGLYLLITVILRQRSHQLTALLPASRLIEALNGLRTSSRAVAHLTGVDLPILLGDENVPHSLQWLISQLSLAKLKEAGLPSLLINPFQPPDVGTDYQQYLQTISAQELNYSIIVRDGLDRVRSQWQQLDAESAREALKNLDRLALNADSATDPMRPKVDMIINGIAPRAKEFTEMLGIANQNFTANSAPPPSVHEITVQLDYVSGIGWIIWALLTFLFGCGVLILSNHGFGTWQDLLKCFLWGIGIQAAGQGLQALAPSSTATTFSLQIGR